MSATKYAVTLKTELGATIHEVDRDSVGNFINTIDWQDVYAFSVEPIEPLAQWEIDLLTGVDDELKEQNNA